MGDKKENRNIKFCENNKPTNIVLKLSAYALIILIPIMLMVAGCGSQKNAGNATNTSAEVSAGATSTKTSEPISSEPPQIPTEPAISEQPIPAETSAPESSATQTPAVTETPSATVEPVPTITPIQSSMTITINETSKVNINPAAIDPDGDFLSYTFSAPLSSSGEWQTKVGDAGEYLITITATDGKVTISKQLKLVVKSLNKAPVIGKMKDVEVKEGEVIDLKPIAVDPDGDELSISYAGFMTGPVKTTNFNDAGEYTETVTVSDGKLSDSQIFKITVVNVNRVPEVMPVLDIYGTEGDLVQIKVAASDSDGTPLMFYFEAPFDEKGFWQTNIGDAKNFSAKVVISDGSDRIEKFVNVDIKAKNKAPVMESIADMTINEGNEVKFTIKASDADNDPLKLTISNLPPGARFNDNTAEFSWTPEYNTVKASEESKIFTVTFMVSDAKEQTITNAKITVNNVNLPPQNMTVDVVVS